MLLRLRRPAGETSHGGGARRPMAACRGFGWKRPRLPLAVNSKNRAWKGASPPEICGFSARARFHVRIGFFLFGATPMTLHDKFGRQITDLRISVTDRCNFRCVYCRSADPENYREHDQIL